MAKVYGASSATVRALVDKCSSEVGKAELVGVMRRMGPAARHKAIEERIPDEFRKHRTFLEKHPDADERKRQFMDEPGLESAL